MAVFCLLSFYCQNFSAKLDVPVAVSNPQVTERKKKKGERERRKREGEKWEGEKYRGGFGGRVTLFDSFFPHSWRDILGGCVI